MIPLPLQAEQRLRELATAFLAENAKINLSAFRTPEACWTGNILDSLSALEAQPLRALSPTPHPSPEGRGGTFVDEDQHPQCNPSVHGGVLSHAREMRKKPTKSEELLWEALRFNQLGTHFRRQHPMKGMILDFYCHDARLCIEVDGPIHEKNQQREQDEDRTERLHEDYGIRVIRFTNEEVQHHLPSVITTIKQELPSLLPPGEGSGMGERKKEPVEGLGGEVESKKILDLGTGGGFPLLPLALCLPQCTFVGMDSVLKKITAVQRIINAVKIPNVSLVCGRSEELARENAHREQYDIVLVRALAELNVILEFAAPFLKVGGHLLCWKSLTIEQELKDSLLARSELSCQMEKPYEYDLGGNWGRRQILIFRKRAKTHAKYPREVGEPKKNPLL